MIRGELEVLVEIRREALAEIRKQVEKEKRRTLA